MVNNPTDYLIPPDDLIEKLHIGKGDFEKIGHGMIKGLITRGFISENSKILDVGCGLGRLARPLTGYLCGSGEYRGLDVSKEAIDWCKSNYSGFDRFNFDWADVHSKFYNPAGAVNGSEFRFPYDQGFFDFVMLTSVFTHLMLSDVDNYLAEIARVIKPGGYCYSTWFLLTDELYRTHEKLVREKHPNARVPIEGGFVTDPNAPERVVLLRQDLVSELYEKNGWAIEKINFGTWCGRDIKGGYQDEIIAKRSAP